MHRCQSPACNQPDMLPKGITTHADINSNHKVSNENATPASDCGLLDYCSNLHSISKSSGISNMICQCLGPEPPNMSSTAISKDQAQQPVEQFQHEPEQAACTFLHSLSAAEVQVADGFSFVPSMVHQMYACLQVYNQVISRQLVGDYGPRQCSPA